MKFSARTYDSFSSQDTTPATPVPNIGSPLKRDTFSFVSVSECIPGAFPRSSSTNNARAQASTDDPSKTPRQGSPEPMTPRNTQPKRHSDQSRRYHSSASSSSIDPVILEMKLNYEDQLQQYKDRIEELERMNGEQKRTIDFRDSTIVSLFTKKTQLQASNAKLEREVLTAESTISDLRSRLDESLLLNRKLEGITEELRLQREQNIACQLELDQLRRERDINSALQKELQDKKAKILELEALYSAQSAINGKIEVTGTSVPFEELKQEYFKLHSDFRFALNEREDEINKLRGQCEVIPGLEEMVRQKNAEINGLLSQLSEARELYLVLENRFEKLDGENTRLREKMNSENERRNDTHQGQGETSSAGRAHKKGDTNMNRFKPYSKGSSGPERAKPKSKNEESPTWGAPRPRNEAKKILAHVRDQERILWTSEPGTLPLTFDSIPWPILQVKVTDDSFTENAIKQYLKEFCIAEHNVDCKEKKKAIAKMLLPHWHPDKFKSRVLDHIKKERMRNRVFTASQTVTRLLILAKDGCLWEKAKT